MEKIPRLYRIFHRKIENPTVKIENLYVKYFRIQYPSIICRESYVSFLKTPTRDVLREALDVDRRLKLKFILLKA